MLAAALTAIAILVPQVPQVPLVPQVPVVRPEPARPKSLVPLYISFSALQVADVHATVRALRHGAREGNPVIRGIADHPAAFLAAKAAAGATTIWLTEKLRKKHPKAALGLMIALNAAMAAVVASNYNIE